MSKWLAERSAAVLEKRTSRRGFLVKGAVAGSALAVSPWRYLLRPGTAYAAINCAGQSCNGGACCDGYTEFCCVVNHGNNSCPPGTFEGGWWRADGSNFCAGGSRYYTDCNVFSGSPCGCRCADGDCNRRRTCCNVFRYGQCHQEIGGTTAISCRVVTCTPPYQIFPCTTDLRIDNSTANHTAACPAPPPPPVPPGFQIQAGHDGQALGVFGGSNDDGASVVQWPSDGSANQRWLLQPLADGSYAFVNRQSGKVLDVAQASTAPGAWIIQWPWRGAPNQKWRLEGVAPNVARIVNVNSNLAVGVAGASGDPGTQVIQWPRNGSPDQNWRFTYLQ
jgi:hypothetical protein